ncbi:MAG: methyltransferase [Candidatus Aminicenantes bacterium]|nr:methyltransferase [Candidatus Aminicenantes bacterium]
MKRKSKNHFLIVSIFFCLGLSVISSFSQEIEENHGLDEKVLNFLTSQRGKWKDLNVPRADGKVLYDLIIKNDYKRALEIGTSTGHSATWIAWALSKTGGKLITIEINETRYRKALANFERAGLSDYIDARLADAHDLVPQLEGPFDFVFIDADKDWYTNYLKLLLPKLELGGCFTVHNVLNLGYMRGVEEFLDYLRSLSNMETAINRASSSGISISYKRSISGSY